jgi:small subunit ribosomal protein S20
MPINESGKKRVRTANKKSNFNREWKDALKDTIKVFEETIEEGDVDKAEKQLQETKGIIDKAVNKNIIHKNNAARKKSRLTKKLNELK